MFEVVRSTKIRILDFDIECRPLTWINSDYVSREVTAIAAQFIGEAATYCWLLGETEPVAMLERFRTLYDQADMVTGHYIRAFDLPLLNSAYVERGLAPLSDKLVSDTKSDLVKWNGVAKSQEAIAAMLGVHAPKVGMGQLAWRSANRLEPEGLELTRQRVIGDVHQNIALRARLVELGFLGSPKVWRPKR